MKKKVFRKLFSLLLCAALLLPVLPRTEAASVYSPWFRSSYLEMEALNILPDKFRNLDLTQSITRREMCELAVPSLEAITGNYITPTRTDVFTDCSEPTILKAYELGIVDGYPDGSFRPDAHLSRQECFSLITKFCRSASLQPILKEGEGSLDGFADKAEVISAWSEEATRICVKYRYVAGASDSEGRLWLNPRSDLTRQEAMTIFLRCFKGLNEYYYYIRNAQVVAIAGSGSGYTVILDGVTVTENYTTLYVDPDLLNVRRAPSTNAEIIGTLHGAEKVSVTGACSNGWLRIVYEDREAFVSGEYLSPASTTEVPSVASDLAVSICNQAMQYLGYPYVWGGTTPGGGFDCSGLVYYVYRGNGIEMNRVADDQMDQGVYVPYDQLMAGDLVFFGYGDYADHVGIYIGNGNFLHAANPSSGVKISSMNETYYVNKYIGAKRVIFS